MRTSIVIAAHGAPPTDYPPRKVGMMMALEFMGKRIGVLRSMHDALDPVAGSIGVHQRQVRPDPKDFAQAILRVFDLGLASLVVYLILATRQFGFQPNWDADLHRFSLIFSALSVFIRVHQCPISKTAGWLVLDSVMRMQRRTT